MKYAHVPELPYVPTVSNLLAHAVERYGDREFLVGDGKRLTFADAEQESARLALGLLGLGVGKGSKVGLLMPNDVDWVLCWLAAARIGAHVTLLSTFYQSRELAWGLRHNDLETLLLASDYLGHDYVGRLADLIPELATAADRDRLFVRDYPYLRRILVWGDRGGHDWAIDGPHRLSAAASSSSQLNADFLAAVEGNVTPADDLVTICTSGSTADPKAVVHSHGVAVRTTYQFLDYLDHRPDDRTYTGQPFFWIGGLNVNLFPSLHLGSCLVFSPSPKPEIVLPIIERERVTRLSMWPAQLRGIKEEAGTWDTTSVRVGYGIWRDEHGDDIPPERRFSSGTGAGLGMTETFGMHSIEKTTIPVPHGKEDNWGRRLPGIERCIVDPETGAVLPPNVEGELYVRGHTLMRGYYKVERENTLTRDGFFATGDRCVIDDDDYLYFTGRSSEMIKTSGANVAPREVELTLMSHAGVREAIVVGIPDERKGESVVAVVVPSNDVSTPDPDDLRDWLRGEISAYKVPDQILFMSFDDVPRTGSAKPHKPKIKTAIMTRRGSRSARSEVN